MAKYTLAFSKHVKSEHN